MLQFFAPNLAIFQDPNIGIHWECWDWPNPKIYPNFDKFRCSKMFFKIPKSFLWLPGSQFSASDLAIFLDPNIGIHCDTLGMLGLAKSEDLAKF